MSNDSILTQKAVSKKQYDELEPFDPSASYVHPTSRPRTKGSKDSSMTPGDGEADEFALGDETSESDGEIEDYEEESDPAKMRRSSRPATIKITLKQSTLPFSPKKTRARTAPDRSAVLLDDSDDEDPLDGSMSPAPRRSTRSKKGARLNLDDAEFVELAEDSDDYGETPQPKKKAPRRNKASRPAYGRFRPIAEADYDSDEDTAVLRAHRGDCAKCNGLPAHVQLQQLKKKKPKKRKSRREEDEFEDNDDDDVRAAKLGGWVRW